MRLLWVVLALQVVLGAGLLVWGLNGFPLPGDADDAPASASQSQPRRVDRISGARAYAFVRFQTDEVGPRPAGSPALRGLAAELRRRLPNGRFQPVPRQPGLRNVIGSIPGRAPAVVVGAHYDTEAEPVGHVGANDGAAGTALVVEIARALRRLPRPRGAREVRFVLFDGEEEPAGCEPFERCGIRGSRAFVRRYGREVGELVLLDYVGARGTRLPREGTSDERLWARLRAAARRVGALRLFPAGTGTGFIDDHMPFLQEGIPAIDLIDGDYRYADTLEDTADKIDPAVLDGVGETVLELVLELRRRPAPAR